MRSINAPARLRENIRSNTKSTSTVNPCRRRERSGPADGFVSLVSLDARRRTHQTTTIFPETITSKDSKRLVELEHNIITAQRASIYAGDALTEIRDARLYKAEFKTFEEYCDKRWGYSRAYVYRLIDAAAIAKDLSPVGDIPSERVARRLATVAKQQREGVFKTALAKLRKNILNEVRAELPHVRSAAKWVAHLPK